MEGVKAELKEIARSENLPIRAVEGEPGARSVLGPDLVPREQTGSSRGRKGVKRRRLSAQDNQVHSLMAIAGTLLSTA